MRASSRASRNTWRSSRSEKAWGKDGYLGEKGLIPLPDAERKQVAENVKALKTLTEVK